MKTLDYIILCGAVSLVIFLKNSDGSNLEPKTTTEKPNQAAVEEVIVSKNSTSTVEGTSSSASSASGATCSCDNSDSPVCASNGVTYKNSCRFDCTKKRVKRLRIVKNGRCNGLTLGQFRATPSRRS